MKKAASSKGFQQDPSVIILLACPNGHHPFIYKDGISVQKMFDNYLLRLPITQRISIGSNKDVYQLTPAQMGIMGKKCFECGDDKKK